MVKTPNIDRLAAQGLSFSHAFITTPICAVSRANILSGQYARRNGVMNFSTPIDLNTMYPALLRSNGYYTGFMGKWGVDSTNPKYMAKVVKSFDYWAGCTSQSNFFHEENCHWVQHDGIHNKADFLCDCPADSGGKKGEEIRSGFANMKNPVHLETVILPRKVSTFLETRDKSKPFCMSISYKSPHAPWDDWDRKFAKLHQGQTIPMKPSATLERARAMPQFLQDTLESDRARKWLENGIFNRQYQDYYRAIATLDDSIGQVREILKVQGLADNTVIIFTSDNGHLMGEHGLSGKWVFYEESIRVPFLIYDPRMPDASRGKVSSAMVLEIDVYPTIAELAGVTPPADIQGASIVPLLDAPEKKLRDGSFFEHHFTLKPPQEIVQSEGYRTQDWKYIRYTQLNPIVEQLFDLRNDPLEENDLAGNLVHHAMLEKLRGVWKKQAEELR